ncbi:ATP-binding protein [Rufibacter immobilis]|uniref:ATP-binding protein n=1 Tax=Rufibacter immobilis TaxID=1348778 RepID=UPI0035EC2B05
METDVTTQEFITNISGKVRNTKLPKAKALWPLFELISNSIHAIEEKGNLKNGQIQVEVIRQGDVETLKDLDDIERYPILSFIVTDNGIGFTAKNFKSFLTAESDYKIEKGAKGIGRFVSLKAFRSVLFDSVFQNGETFMNRSFEFKALDKGIHGYKELPVQKRSSKTSVTLNIYREEYKSYCPKSLNEIAEKIVEHFLIYFLQDKCPNIRLIDTNGNELLLQNYFGTTFKGSIKKATFNINSESFVVSLLRVFNTRKTHQLHYCANEREVDYETLTKYLPDLGKNIKDEDGTLFSYHAYVTGNFLDETVDNERVGFNLETESEDSDELENKEDITLQAIRRNTIAVLEKLLEPYLNTVRQEKFEDYKEHIIHAAPQYRSILKYNPEAIKRMQPKLKGNKLDIELFKVQNELETSMKILGEEVLNADKDFTKTDEYLSMYNNYIEQFNDLGKANLAKYIIHRKAVIELLDKFIGVENEDESFQREDTIHSIFFPIRTESDEITYDKQNLWLIDERLAYHNYLASDKTFKKIPVTDSQSADRPDLLIFNDSFAFVDDDAPHRSFTIVEFKRPERDDYSFVTAKKNPVDQVVQYVRTIRENKATDRRGKTIDFTNNNIPFYVYIVADLNPSLREILEEKDFRKTPDSLGYFMYHDRFNAYIEVLTYQKLLKDAKMRNRILFDSLGIPTN